MKNIIAFFILSGIIFLQILSSHARAEEILIVANKSVLINALDRKTITDIYMGTRTRWDNGEKIRVVMLKRGPVHGKFTKEILSTTPSRLRNLWKKALFTGKGTPPKIRKTEEEIVNIISSTKGAIGYINPSTNHDNVKVLIIE